MSSFGAPDGEKRRICSHGVRSERRESGSHHFHVTPVPRFLLVPRGFFHHRGRLLHLCAASDLPRAHPRAIGPKRRCAHFHNRRASPACEPVLLVCSERGSGPEKYQRLEGLENPPLRATGRRLWSLLFSVHELELHKYWQVSEWNAMDAGNIGFVYLGALMRISLLSGLGVTTAKKTADKVKQ